LIDLQVPNGDQNASSTRTGEIGLALAIIAELSLQESPIAIFL
jgi:hypothetical protein